MTNPLEQIREFRAVIERIANDYVPYDEHQSAQALEEMRDALKSALADHILDASQGYVCVPVEQADDGIRWRMLLTVADEVVGSSWVWQADDDEMTPLTERIDQAIAASKETSREPS